MDGNVTTILSKDALLSGELLKRKLVCIEDWNISIWMKELSGDVIREYRRRIRKFEETGTTVIPDEQGAEMMTYILANSICDENGVLQFTEEEAKTLTVNSFDMITALVNKAFEISGAKLKENGEVVSEVADNLPNDPMTSLSENSPLNLDEPAEKS